MALKSHISSNTYSMKPYYSTFKGNSPWNILDIKVASFVYSLKSYCALKIEIPEGHFRHILLFYFRKGKNAAQ